MKLKLRDPRTVEYSLLNLSRKFLSLAHDIPSPNGLLWGFLLADVESYFRKQDYLDRVKTSESI